MARKNYALSVSCLFVTTALGACGNSHQRRQDDVPNPEPQVVASADQHTVMVVDTGFDPDNSEFAGKIIARYTLACKEANTGGSTDNSPTTKEKLIADLQVADQSCFVQEGTTPNISADFATIAPFRSDWNKFLQSKGTDEQAFDSISPLQSDIRAVLAGDDTHMYHGTATAGSIAYKNPKVKLVLVEATLGNPNTQPVDVSCPYTTTQLQRVVDLLSDADVQKAYINQPASSEETQLADLIVKHNIDLINESFGTDPTPYVVLAIKKNCILNPDVTKLVALYTQMQKIRGSLDAQRRQILDQQLPNQTKALTIKSAGNSGALINDSADLTDCGERGDHKWLIGAIDDERKIASFSNRGDCVDAYALGVNVLVPAPQNFVNEENGTSFSAPLFVRWITLQLAPGQSPKAMGEQMRAKLDANRYVPKDAVAEELAYDHTDILMDGFGIARTNSPQPALPRRVRPLPTPLF